MQFKDIIGHVDIKKQLIKTVNEQRISHAQLFFGPSGTGKLALALAYAQYISCSNKQDSDSCGVCPSCKKYQKLIHPDLHFVFPVISQTGKLSVSDTYITQWREKVLENPYFNLESWLITLGSENKQASIFKDEARAILQKLSLKSFESEFKVMIIWLPEKMNNTVANKLLKIIEEPPQKTLFILISNQREEILPTISSRTQPIKISRLKPDDIASSLQHREGLSSERAFEISKLSGGSYIQALNHINTSQSRLDHFDSFVSLMRLAYQRKGLEVMDWAKTISREGREKQKSFLAFGLRMLRENFVIQQGIDKVNMLLEEEAGFAKKFSTFITPHNINQLSEAFEEAHYHITRNVNSQIVFTDLGFIVMQELRNKS